MATEEDNFDIDIYGDGGEDYQEEGQVHEAEQQAAQVQSHREEMAGQTSNATGHESAEVEHDDGHASQKVEASGGSSADHLNAPKQAPQAQGLKRKEGADDRTVDAGATTALFVSDLHWWITDDDIRGWANQSECEDELTEITFSEHKVNGKSKGHVLTLELRKVMLI